MACPLCVNLLALTGKMALPIHYAVMVQALKRAVRPTLRIAAIARKAARPPINGGKFHQTLRGRMAATPKHFMLEAQPPC
ncbi:hypothetical protein CQ12_06405 [Bradyrhizobium jicamae]|uniref:Uncharacterized protein n=1 Tax=Bradyrhizobium jicamae TaxID=280332 RepID=A0A0R3LYX2_9BRAD|nr:hypothetical protein CQ12_06405 [Bradyrhizobium jicamae]